MTELFLSLPFQYRDCFWCKKKKISLPNYHSSSKSHRDNKETDAF